MVSEMNTRLRLVRCPRCHKVLPELPEIPVYKCGGCGTVLRAKIRKNDAKEAGSCLAGVNLAQSNQVEHVSEHEEARSLNQLATLPSTGESISDKVSERVENEYEDCNRKHSGRKNDSNLVHSSSASTFHENEQLSPDSQACREADEDKCPLDQFNGRDDDKFSDFSREHSDGVNYSNVLPSSTELTSHGNEQLSSESRTHVGADQDESLLGQYNGRYQNEFGDSVDGWPEKINFSNEVSSTPELHLHENKPSSAGAETNIEVDSNPCSLKDIDGGNQNDFGDCSREWLENTQISDKVISSSELACHEIEEPSPLSGADTVVGGNFEGHHTFRTLSAESLLPTRPRDPSVTAQGLPAESISPENLTPSHNEQPEQSQKNTLQGFERVSSIDTLDNIPLDPNSELGVALRYKYKSPTARSYYGYDGSVSSYDETDDQDPDQHLCLSKKNFEDAGLIGSKGFPRSNKLMMNNMVTRESKMQHRAMNSSSILPGKNHHGTNGSSSYLNEMPESRRHVHPNRCRMRLESVESLPRVPFYSRGFQVAHENGSSSSYGHNKFHFHSSFHSTNEPEYTGQDKMELLQMVYVLQDQLNKLHIPNGQQNGRFPAGVVRNEKQVPAYDNLLAPDEEVYPDLDTRFLGRYSQEKGWPHHCKIPRMAFSGEASYNGHQSDCSCLHCCHQDWHRSAQLPPHDACCNKGHCMTYPSHKSYCPCHSSLLSPQHYTRSECSSWSCDTNSDDHWGKNHDARKLYVREKQQLMKRHSRPIAGGAPIIACYHCTELLQLPTDFILFERRYHYLRCCACSKVLKFSLQNKTHLAPYVAGVMAPPPSEVDESGDAVSKRNLSATSHANGLLHAEPVSFSDDYGLPFSRSCSTDGDPSSLIPFQTTERNLVDRKLSSGGSFGPSEDRKESVSGESKPSSNMSMWEKPSPEIEESRESTGSCLHQLMGYSSPSEVINR